jgi:hypothetical protein
MGNGSSRGVTPATKARAVPLFASPASPGFHSDYVETCAQATARLPSGSPDGRMDFRMTSR